MREMRWYNGSQPQALSSAVALLYLNAVLGLLTGLFGGGATHWYVLLLICEAAGAFGVANDRRWGYYLALVSSGLLGVLFVALAAYYRTLNANLAIAVLLQIVLVVLLLHPQSRSYRRIWFR